MAALSTAPPSTALASAFLEGGRVDLSGGPVDGDLNVEWIHGSPPRSDPHDPPIQVHQFDEHTFILRQGKHVTREAPFLFLLFGSERALLLDTGAVKDPSRMPLRRTIDHLIENWLGNNPRDDYELVVAHSHSHRDHISGDDQFADRPRTTVVATELASVREFFGFQTWPRETVDFDLGDRALEITGSPGHHPAAISIFDPWSGFLLTGDTVYPGRLYVNDAPAFRATLDTLVDIISHRPVTAVMGCHIEMTRTDRHDYPIGAQFQPDEPPLQMTMAQLVSVREAAHLVGDRKGAHVFDDFAIYNGPCVIPTIRSIVRRVLGSSLPSRS